MNETSKEIVESIYQKSDLSFLLDILSAGFIGMVAAIVIGCEYIALLKKSYQEQKKIRFVVLVMIVLALLVLWILFVYGFSQWQF